MSRRRSIRRDLIVRSAMDLPASLPGEDRAEIERFADLLRRANGATCAGVPRAEAVRAIYPDVYPNNEKGSAK